jgi:uncharacterized protein (DUF1810 family)
MPIDPFDLARFVSAQDEGGVYEQALAELNDGRKRTHWMWFIFPQAAGLGTSPISRRYAIRTVEEAGAYLAHPVLGRRIEECANSLLTLEGRSAAQILASPDDLKLRSSMTLFEMAAPPGAVYGRVIEKYFGGRRDDVTRRLMLDAQPPQSGPS